MGFFRKLRRDEEGATAIEYGLIAVAAITAMGNLGTQLRSTFDNTKNCMAGSDDCEQTGGSSSSSSSG
jgi:pilus assembly protein Flp/PilA